MPKIWKQMQKFSKRYEIKNSQKLVSISMSDFRIFRIIFLKIVHCVARIGAIWMQIWHSWSGFSKKHVLHFCAFAIHQNGKTNKNNYNYFYILHFCWLFYAHISRIYDFLVCLAAHNGTKALLSLIIDIR